MEKNNVYLFRGREVNLSFDKIDRPSACVCNANLVVIERDTVIFCTRLKGSVLTYAAGDALRERKFSLLFLLAGYAGCK